MDKHAAIIIAGSAVGATRELGSIPRTLSLSGREDAGHEIGLSAASIVDQIFTEILNPIWAEFPELKDEMEERMEKYERFL